MRQLDTMQESREAFGAAFVRTGDGVLAIVVTAVFVASILLLFRVFI